MKEYNFKEEKKGEVLGCVVMCLASMALGILLTHIEIYLEIEATGQYEVPKHMEFFSKSVTLTEKP